MHFGGNTKRIECRLKDTLPVQGVNVNIGVAFIPKMPNLIESTLFINSPDQRKGIKSMFHGLCIETQAVLIRIV